MIPSAAVKSKNLLNFLAPPSRLASNFDWKHKTAAKVLAIDIGADKIGLAVAPHPSSNRPIRTLRPLELKRHITQDNRKVLSEHCIDTMAAIVKEHNICALLVSWPVQNDGGRCGKPCGQVLHTLDNLLSKSNSIVTKSRPVCLWDDRHVKITASDSFGRDPLFGRCTATKEKTIHRASQEQYKHHDCSSAVAAQVWLDFCQTYWPVEQQIHDKAVPRRKQPILDCTKDKSYRIQDEEEDSDDELLQCSY
jgi:RNase H-fold protein (predicted Holliday junction resolvase)